MAIVFKFKEPIGGITGKEKFTTGVEPNARQRVILNFIRDTKIATKQQIFDHLTLKFSDIPTKKTLTRDLNYLKSIGLIELKGQKRGAIWIAKEQ